VIPTASLATDLQGIRDQLMNLANSTDGNGRYIFAGYKTEAAAFDSTGDYAARRQSASRLIRRVQCKSAIPVLKFSISSPAAQNQSQMAVPGNEPVQDPGHSDCRAEYPDCRRPDRR
jgi:flagellin-like hook-associated protein FlgL